jgi:N-acetylglutamate synthase/N-acetylornithine aminotransferase
MKAATMPGSAMGRMIVRNAPQIDSPSTSAASSSSVGIEANWSRMIQMTMGSTGQRVEQDQPDPRVEQRQLLVEHEERQGEHHRRQDQLRQEEERDVVVLHEAELVGKRDRP